MMLQNGTASSVGSDLSSLDPQLFEEFAQSTPSSNSDTSAPQSPGIISIYLISIRKALTVVIVSESSTTPHIPAKGRVSTS